MLRRNVTIQRSKNSHNRLATDKWDKNQSLREKSNKPVGGQKGRKDKTLKMVATPDVTERIYPNDCNRCSKSLEGSTFELEGCRQVIDIPPIVPMPPTAAG
ncbi:MAG: hypothetical protein DYG98_06425 [Haliscomenobacteraceae bacterium CHB4]|nr:hypothetical protein [Haliscomenobacteraceae bacterium CHB4]